MTLGLRPVRERVVCPHLGTGTLYNPERRIAFKADCGQRANCAQARRRWRFELRERLNLVEYLRTPDLWTFTARTAEQDGLYRARKMGLRAADAFLLRGEDRGSVNRANLDLMRQGLERLIRYIDRQVKRQRQPGYERSAWAVRLRLEYGTDRPVRGRPGAALRIRIREAGELHGRLHTHAASDFIFLDHGWLDAAALRCGLGHVQFERRETGDLHMLASISMPAARGSAIALYLSKYLSSTPDDAPWPWPRRSRLVSSARGQLPPRPRKEGWHHTWLSVARVAVDEFGAVCVDADASFYRARDDPDARSPAAA
jgi:hypothetical protein